MSKGLKSEDVRKEQYNLPMGGVSKLLKLYVHVSYYFFAYNTYAHYLFLNNLQGII